VGQFGYFCAFPAKYALTKIAMTFGTLNQFYRVIACFKGKSVSFKLMCYEILNLTLLKIFGWLKFAQISK
jgi:hypothetical protein